MAKATGTDQRQKPTFKQLEELLRFTQGQMATVVTRYFTSANFDDVQSMLKNQKNVGRMFEILLAPLFANPDPHSAQRAYWEKIFRDHYSLDADFSTAVIPERPTEGRWQLIGIAKGLTMNHAADVYKKIIVAHDSHSGFWKYNDDLDAMVTKNVRTSSESYFVWVRDEIEPDREFLGKPTRDADPDQTIGVTLTERLVHGTVHFIETKQHLDEKGVTFCTGSRDADGSVPDVYWSPGCRKVYVDWYGVGSVSPRSGLRSAVSS